MLTVYQNCHVCDNNGSESFMWAALREKVRNALSHYQAQPSFFWYATDFSKRKKKEKKKMTMTMTQAIGDLSL